MGKGGHGFVRVAEAGVKLYAPPPASHSGVADYAGALHARLLAFGDPPVPLYHLGNNQLHSEIYRRSMAAPGVTVLHDAVLHHFLLGTLTREEYVAEFVYNYGEWRRHVAEDLWAERGSSGVSPRYFEFPMLRRAVERARAVIVHNPGAAKMAREHGAREVTTIPHFFDPAGVTDVAEGLMFRHRIGASTAAPLFGMFGYLRETKRVMPTLRAFERLRRIWPSAMLLVAGEAVSRDLARLLETEAAGPGIIRMPHLSEGELRAAVSAIDCCINLRYPAAGETSGIAVRAMGAGKLVILTAGLETSDIPAAACLRVTPGIAESAELSEHMILAAEFPRIAREIGSEARRHILERHSLDDAAKQYWQVMCATSSH